MFDIFIEKHGRQESSRTPMKSSRLVLRYIGRTTLRVTDADFPVPCEDMDNLPPGVEFEIPDAGIVLGRSVNADVHVFWAHVKHAHARLWPVEDGITVEDLASTNGTALNGALFSRMGTHEQVIIRPGDRLTLAGTHDFEVVER